VENGLSFSSPDVEVEIYGRKTGGRYLLAVVDYGIGMPRDELEKARARLRDEENFLVAPTRFLGHYVVGRLARQLSVQVDLGESPVSGITARMLLPAELLAERPDPPAPDARSTRSRPGPPPARAIPTGDAEPSVKTAPVPAPEPEPVTQVDPATHRWPTDEEAAEPTVTAVPVGALAIPRPASGSGGAERTRNGLPKRQPRHRSGTASRPAAAARHTTGESTPDRTPTEVGTMLAAFRHGHQRGERNGWYAGGDEPAPSLVAQEEPGDH
jgi:hypothetical protein